MRSGIFRIGSPSYHSFKGNRQGTLENGMIRSKVVRASEILADLGAVGWVLRVTGVR